MTKTIHLSCKALNECHEAIKRGDKFIIINDLFIAFYPLRITSHIEKEGEEYKEKHFSTSAYDRRMIKKYLKQS